MNGHRKKNPNFVNIIRLGLVLFLVLSSIAILYATARNYRSARLLADQSLESTALALSSMAEIALHRLGTDSNPDVRDIFSDRVVAYAMIADDEGKILFHTNPDRIGAVLPPLERGPLGMPQQAHGHRITLGMGLPAYEFNYPLLLAEGRPRWLRLTLHTAPVDRIVTDARTMWWIGSAVLLFLWIIGILFERALSRSLKLRSELDRKEHLAVIGQMTAVLAHEIRNALGSVKGYAQWVNEKLDSGDPKKAALASVLEGTGRIEYLVHELLQFSRDEHYAMERVDVVPLLKDAIQTATAGWNGTHHLQDHAEFLVHADAEKLRRVLINVVQNAVHAMGTAGTLNISVRQTGKHVDIKIEDTGTGIPGAQMPLLFTPLHTTKTDGIGLGLAYSKKVIEGMNGNIRLRNRDGKPGAVLTIHLPKAGA